MRIYNRPPSSSYLSTTGTGRVTFETRVVISVLRRSVDARNVSPKTLAGQNSPKKPRRCQKIFLKKRSENARPNAFFCSCRWSPRAGAYHGHRTINSFGRSRRARASVYDANATRPTFSANVCQKEKKNPVTRKPLSDFRIYVRRRARRFYYYYYFFASPDRRRERARITINHITRLSTSFYAFVICTSFFGVTLPRARPTYRIVFARSRF